MDAGSLSDARENKDCKFDNTPSSSNEVFSSKDESYFEKSVFSKLRSINKLENLVKIMKSECESLSQITQDSLGKISQNTDDSSLSESSSQHLLLTTLIDIITSCTRLINVLQNCVKHYLSYSRKCWTSINRREQVKIENKYDIDECGLIKVPIQDIVHALVDILPIVFTEDSQLREELKVLARKVSRVENSCDICVCELKTVWIIIQKMFLFFSLGDDKLEVKYSIDELVSCLLNSNFSCESEYDEGSSSNNDSFLSERISSIYLLPFADDSWSIKCNCDDVCSSKDLESSNSEFHSNENGANLQCTNISIQRQYLKIAHIESPYTSDEFCNEKGAFKTELNRKYNGENDCVSLDLNSQENVCTSLRVKGKKCNSLNNVRKNTLFEHSLGKFWMSLDSFPRYKTSDKQPPEEQNKLSSNSSKSRVADSKEKSKNIQNPLKKAFDIFSPNSKPKVNRENSYPHSRTTSSSFTNPSNFEYPEDISRKVRTDTVQVKMVNKGEGFGLTLGVKYNATRSSIVPVIRSIIPKSPAQRSGVLKVDDRIIAINHQNTLALTPNELQVLNKQSFSARVIILKVEFDVVEAEPRFGTFDIILDKTVKIGLVFKDMKRGFPMFVSGIVKGSGAHRCGQLFPRDKIKFFRCIRNEEFDPVSCNYSKEESVLITVQRDPQGGLWDKSGCVPPCYFNPSFNHVDSVPRRGKSFVVRNTTVHTVGGTEVLDQEVTLFRDPVCWDFGLLVGENPDTGRAYVTDVRAEGPAADSGAVKKFDRIIQVNGILVDRNIENSILALLSQANHKVDLLIRRLYREDSQTA